MQVTKREQYLDFIIEKAQANQTIRTFLQSFSLSKKTIHHLYMNKAVTLNQDVKSFETPLKEGDCVSIAVFLQEGLDFIPQKMPLEIVYEDDHVLMVNKPAGIMVHPDEKSKKETLVNGVAYYYQQKNYLERVRYIHRIDTDTSGIVIFAKHQLVHAKMDEWLSKKIIKRRYLAFVHGCVKKKKGTINQPIGRDRHHASRRRVCQSGDVAKTHYEILNTTPTYSQVKLQLETGRTHQIRVHMSHIGHPLLGDTLYGGKNPFHHLKRHALHAYEVQMPHPLLDHELLVTAPLPQDLKKLT